MQSELIAVIAMLAINVIGWAYTLWQNSNRASANKGRMETKVCNLEKQVGSLPCQKEPDYIENMGAIKADIRSIKERLGRIEKRI